MKGIFGPAITEMKSQDLRVFGPKVFDEYVSEIGGYLRANSLTVKSKTPAYISIDHLEKLNAELREHQIMVLRLGKPGGRGTKTQFALIRTCNDIASFFLVDKEVFGNAIAEKYIPNRSARSLFPFSLIKPSSEANLLNFSLASGVLQNALGVEKEFEHFVPATGMGNYSFEFRPYSNLPESYFLLHKNGQVEIDSLFLGKRGGCDYLFVVEAKMGVRYATLAKHKLYFACKAIAEACPKDITIVPVYLRIEYGVEGLRFYTCECEFDRDPLFSIDSLIPVRESTIFNVPHIQSGF